MSRSGSSHSGLSTGGIRPGKSGISRIASSPAGLPALQRALPGSESLAPLPAVVVERARAPRLADLPGAAYVERLGSRRLAYTPNDPLAAKQWYLGMTRAFDYWDSAPTLAPVRVAVIDSGVDAGHPELANRIAMAESFVGTLKAELVRGRPFKTRFESELAVAAYLGWFNHTRMHSSLGDLSPDQFEIDHHPMKKHIDPIPANP